MKLFWLPFILFTLSPEGFGDQFEEIYNQIKFGPKEELGRMLFFDKILSGNQNISCATCHNPLTFTGDGISLPVGEGGQGFGPSRNTGNTLNKIIHRIPRNTPPLFNLGYESIFSLFHDGRVELNEEFPSGVKTPLEMDLPERLDGLLAAQVFFPIINPDEMAGHKGENPIADLVAKKEFLPVFTLLSKKLRNNEEYVKLFMAAFPDQVRSEKDMRFFMAANAIAAFEIAAFSSLNSPYDKFLKGDLNSLSPSAKNGLEIFNGKGKCIQCHKGILNMDNSFHSIAMPQIGPGKGHGEKGFEDFGREIVTKNQSDRFKFKTPSLRNVALTGPWGHDGAYGSLRDVILHHLNPVSSLQNYSLENAYLPSRVDLDLVDGMAMKDQDYINELLNSNETSNILLSEKELDDLLNFLYSLTDPAVYELPRIIPKRVPSDLPVSD